MNKYKGIMYAILSSVAFGLMPIFAKYAYINGSNPTSVLIFRFLFAAIILFIYLKIKKINIKIGKNKFLLLFLIGLLGYSITTQTLFTSYSYLGVGLATALHFIYPVIVCLFGFIVLKEKMSKTKLLSLLLSGIGVYTLVAFENKTLSTIGLSLAIFSGVTYGLTVAALGLKSLKELDNRIVTMYLSFGGFVGMLLYGMVTNNIIWGMNINVFTSYIGLAVVSTICSIILLLKAIEIIGTGSSSILGTFEPIVSIILGIILFNETLSIGLLLGTILIIISTIMLVKDK